MSNYIAQHPTKLPLSRNVPRVGTRDQTACADVVQAEGRFPSGDPCHCAMATLALVAQSWVATQDGFSTQQKTSLCKEGHFCINSCHFNRLCLLTKASAEELKYWTLSLWFQNLTFWWCRCFKIVLTDDESLRSFLRVRWYCVWYKDIGERLESWMAER